MYNNVLTSVLLHIIYFFIAVQLWYKYTIKIGKSTGI